MSDDARQAAGQACIADKQEVTQSEGMPIESLPSRAEIGALATPLAERRGEYTFTVIASDDVYGLCFMGPGGGGGTLHQLDDNIDIRTGESVIPAAEGLVTLQAGLSAAKAGTYSYLVGRAGVDVASVEVLTGGRWVAATVMTGHFVAWWPGSDAATSVRVGLVNGTQLDGMSPQTPVFGERGSIEVTRDSPWPW